MGRWDSWGAFRVRRCWWRGGPADLEPSPGLFVLAGGGELARELSQEFAGREQRVVSGPEDADREGWRSFFESLPDEVPLRGVAHLAGVGEDEAGLTTEELGTAVASVGESGLALVQGLSDAGVRPSAGGLVGDAGRSGVGGGAAGSALGSAAVGVRGDGGAGARGVGPAAAGPGPGGRSRRWGCWPTSCCTRTGRRGWRIGAGSAGWRGSRGCRGCRRRRAGSGSGETGATW